MEAERARPRVLAASALPLDDVQVVRRGGRGSSYSVYLCHENAFVCMESDVVGRDTWGAKEYVTLGIAEADAVGLRALDRVVCDAVAAAEEWRPLVRERDGGACLRARLDGCVTFDRAGQPVDSARALLGGARVRALLHVAGAYVVRDGAGLTLVGVQFAVVRDALSSSCMITQSRDPYVPYRVTEGHALVGGSDSSVGRGEGG